MAAEGKDADHWVKEGDDRERTVGFPELFFDLVFVFALIQLSHFVADDFTPAGLAEGGVFALALWWVWNHTAWVTNRLDPERMPVRALLFSLMFLGLLMSSAIPKAFEDRALLFAATYVAMQLGRSIFAVFAFRHVLPDVSRNFQRVSIWFALSGVVWIAGALVEPELRLYIWYAALLIEFAAPELRFPVPGMGRSSSEDWHISGEHMAERCGLFVMICLGESILATGRSFSEQDMSPIVVTILAGSFLSIGLMWWIYFHFGHEKASREIEEAAEPGEVALHVFTYAHIPVIAGVILCAVAAEHLLAHPYESGGYARAFVVIGGPVVFLAGNLWVKWATTDHLPHSHLLGIAALLSLMLVTGRWATLWSALGAVVVLLCVAVWEYRRLARIPHAADEVGELEGE
ncbi:low temperature requirement protein A [Rhizobium helianthi]|uniref:Low temperature requirement protein A n=1 Tax=Rhizobium helianthi TaxID=1132695 RepID=A0ABW4M0K3_9HYPH